MSRTQTLFRLPRNHKCFLHSTLSILACSSTIPKHQMKEGVFEWLRWRFWRVCSCASEDAVVLSTKTRDGSPDRGVTIKMSRHWMRPLNTRIYARYIPSRTHCFIQYSLWLDAHLPLIFPSLLRRHIWNFSSPFDPAGVLFASKHMLDNLFVKLILEKISFPITPSSASASK